MLGDIKMELNNMKLLKAVAKLDSEYVNTELGKENFLAVTSISQIEKFFSVDLKEIDKQFQELKDAKYKYDEFCELCDNGKEDEYKLLLEVFDYLEIQKFSEMIISEVAKGFQYRIGRM